MKQRSYGYIKFAAIAVNAIVMMILALSGGLAYMMADLNISSETAVLILMIPNFVAIPFCFFCGSFCNKFSTRNVALFGTAVFAITGVAPCFLQNVTAILVVRALHGIGYAFCSSCSATLVTEYCPDDADSLMGIKQSVQNVFAIAYGLLGGYLATLNWRYSYLLYLIAVPIFFIMLGLPKRETKAAQTEKVKVHLTGKTWAWCIGMFIFMLSIACFSNHMSEIVVGREISDATGSGAVVSISTAFGVVAGLVFGRVFKALGKLTRPLSLLLVAITQFMIPLTDSYLVIALAGGIQGLAYSTAVPCALMGTAGSCDAESSGTAIGIMVSFMLLGNVCSDYVLAPMSSLLGGGAAGKYYGAAIIGLVCMVYFFVLESIKKPETQAA